MKRPAPATTRQFTRPQGWRYARFDGVHGMKLRYGYVVPQDGPHIGTVVMTGGYGRPIEHYYEAINNWRDRGYAVYAMDWAGMGGSERAFADAPQRPPVLPFEQQARLLHQFVQTIVRPPKEKPAFLVSHSFGGHISLRYLSLYEKRDDFPFDGVILGAPMIDINTALIPRGAAKRLLQIFNKAGGAQTPLPRVSRMYTDFFNAVFHRHVEHDPAREAAAERLRRRTAHIQLGNPTPAWLLAAMQSSDTLRQRPFLEGIQTPVLVLTAARDNLVSVKAQERAAMYMPHAILVKVPGAQHGLWNDSDRVQAQLWNVIETFTDGLRARHTPLPAQRILPPPPPDIPLSSPSLH